MALVRNNAARMIEEKDLTVDKLLSVIDELKNDRALLKTIGQNARKMAVLDSAKVICDKIMELAK